MILLEGRLTRTETPITDSHMRPSFTDLGKARKIFFELADGLGAESFLDDRTILKMFRSRDADSAFAHIRHVGTPLSMAAIYFGNSRQVTTVYCLLFD